MCYLHSVCQLVFTIWSFDDINRVLARAQFALHVKVKAVWISRIFVHTLWLGQIMPFIRLFATIRAFYFKEKRVIWMIGFEFVNIFQCCTDLQTDFHHIAMTRCRNWFDDIAFDFKFIDRAIAIVLIDVFGCFSGPFALVLVQKCQWHTNAFDIRWSGLSTDVA